MNECDVCGPHHGKDHHGIFMLMGVQYEYHLCEAHYLAS